MLRDEVRSSWNEDSRKGVKESESEDESELKERK